MTEHPKEGTVAETGRCDETSLRNGRGGNPRLKLPRNEPVVQVSDEIVSIFPQHDLAGPIHDRTREWEDSEERRACWEGEPPPIDVGARRCVHDVDQELSDYLGSCVPIVVGRIRGIP